MYGKRRRNDQSGREKRGKGRLRFKSRSLGVVLLRYLGGVGEREWSGKGKGTAGFLYVCLARRLGWFALAGIRVLHRLPRQLPTYYTSAMKPCETVAPSSGNRLLLY